MIRFLLCLVCCSVLLVSCEKNISIKLKPTSTDLVVDASIENGDYPVVYLSRSLNYFNRISAELLLQAQVHNAHIEISNGTQTDTLQEFTIYADTGGLALTYYSFNRDDSSGKFVGELEHHYTISITVDGKIYTGSTTIPSFRKTLDSVWWEPAPKLVDSTKVVVKARITDPPGLGDYTRYYTSVNSGAFYPGQQSVFDDAITDGTTYDITVDKGIDRNLSSTSTDDDNFFSHGDTATVKLANIDKATYDFWRTMEYNYQSIGNPFSSPVTVLSNLSGGALGYFGGYAAMYQSVIIPQ